MFVLFTDFGHADPYVGQLHAVLKAKAPTIPIIDLLHAVPDFDIRAGAYLLPAYVREFPEGAVFVCVVDPGVGGERKPTALAADGRWFVGPDNGLLEIVARRARESHWHHILWRPETLSVSFHGRDLFAPAAAALYLGEPLDMQPVERVAVNQAQWPDDLYAVVYVDHYGNAVTGLRSDQLAEASVIRVGHHILRHCRVFGEADGDTPFWYKNSVGLVEFAVNRGRADVVLGLSPGATFEIA